MESAPFQLDRAQALATVGGDTEFLAELVGIFEAACPVLLNDIQVALANADLTAAGWSARLLRVAAENIKACNVTRLAQLLETLAREKKPRASADTFRALQNEIARLKPVLGDLTGEATRLVF